MTANSCRVYRSRTKVCIAIPILLTAAMPLWIATTTFGFDSGSTGADLTFAPSANTVVDLALAGTGPGTGIYDVAVGAIVFNYTTVNIPAGVTISFKNHPHNPPVVWLASGDVTLNGIVDLSGRGGHGSNAAIPFYTAGGPGGFPGGLGKGNSPTQVPTPGLGPGGGLPGSASVAAGSGSYATVGLNAVSGSTYGSPRIQPLIGGSGGGGNTGGALFNRSGGSSGGGAILIASSAIIRINAGGGISALGGSSTSPHGSGGAIRLVANDILGNGGVLNAYGEGSSTHGQKGLGRIRLEVAANPGMTNFLTTCNPTPSFGQAGPILPTAASPTLRATMVADQNVPADPAGNVFGDPDVTINNAGPLTIQLQATNIPPGTIIKVRAAPDNATAVFADSTPLAGTPQFSTATASITFPPGLSHVTLNAAFELAGQARAEPKGSARPAREGIASTEKPGSGPILGVMNVNGHAIRRVEITSSGNPLTTRVVYHPDESTEAVKSSQAATGWFGNLSKSAETVIVRARHGAADMLSRAHRAFTEYAAVKSKMTESPGTPVPQSSSDSKHQTHLSAPPRPVSLGDTAGSNVHLASYTPGQQAVPRRPAPAVRITNDLDPSYTYDKVSDRLTMTDPTGVTTYEYDAANRLTKIRNPSGQEITFTYDKVGRRKQMTYPNGVVTSYTYDAGGRITRITAAKGATVITDFQYSYDEVGNILTMTTPAGVHGYTYDGLYQLTGATHPEPGNPAESFTYDPTGNRLTSHLSSFHTHDAANRLLADAGHVYTYDANGNQTSRTAKDAGGQPTGEKFVFTYNADNQLIAAKRYAAAADASPTMTAEYIYDGLGRRLAKTVNNTVTEFVYDNEDILLELQGPVGQPRKIVARYTHGPRIDEPLIMQRDTNGDGTLDATYFYHADHLGTIRAITDASGNVVQTYTYDSFGQIIAQAGAIPNFYTYTARERDAETGLFYFRSRYYCAAAGRFVREDSLGFLGGINLYSYVHNNAVNTRDPFGLQDASCERVPTIEIQRSMCLGGNHIGGTVVYTDSNGNKLNGYSLELPENHIAAGIYHSYATVNTHGTHVIRHCEDAGGHDIHIGNRGRGINPKTGRPDSTGCSLLGKTIQLDPGIPLLDSGALFNPMYEDFRHCGGGITIIRD